MIHLYQCKDYIMDIIRKTFMLIVVYTIQTPLFAKIHNVSNVNALHRAVSKAKPGDTIRLSAGKYNLKKRIVIEGKSNITIEGKAYRTILNGRRVKNTTLDELTGQPISWLGLIHIEKSEDIKISGIRLKNSNFAGFYIEDSERITIEDSSTHNTYSSGIGVWDNSHSIYLYGNEISKACNGGGEESITVAISEDVEVIGNDVHHNGRKEF